MGNIKILTLSRKPSDAAEKINAVCDDGYKLVTVYVLEDIPLAVFQKKKKKKEKVQIFSEHSINDLMNSSPPPQTKDTLQKVDNTVTRKSITRGF